MAADEIVAPHLSSQGPGGGVECGWGFAGRGEADR